MRTTILIKNKCNSDKLHLNKTKFRIFKMGGKTNNNAHFVDHPKFLSLFIIDGRYRKVKTISNTDFEIR